MLKNVVVGSHGSSTFGFVRNLHTGFHSGHTDLRSHQQCGRVWPVPLMLAPHGLALRDAPSSGTLIWDPSQVLCVCLHSRFLPMSGVHVPPAFLSGGPGYGWAHGPVSVLTVSSHIAVFSSSLKGCTESGFTHHSPAAWALPLTWFIRPLFLTQHLPSSFITYRWIPQRRANCILLLSH